MQKKDFTSFDVAAVVRELKETVLDSRVSNIYQLNPKTMLFKLHKPEKPIFGLVLESAKRLHLTSYIIEKPLLPPAFCMALRKYLRNVWLTDIEQYEFERVVIFSFKTKTGGFKLILELFGEGNIILVDERGKILHALIYKCMRDRNILREETFVFAPPSGKNPLRISKEEFREELESFGNVKVVRTLARCFSIGGIYAEETLLKANVDKTRPCNTLNQSEISTIFDNLQTMLFQVSSGKLEPSIILDKDGCFVDVVPFRLKRYESLKHQPYSSFNEALDEFYVKVATIERATTHLEVKELEKEEERLKRIIESQEKILSEAEAKRYRNIGEAIYTHADALQALLDRFLTAKKSGKEWNAIVSEVLAEKRSGLKPSVFFESFDAKGLIVNVCVDSLRFGLNLRGQLFDTAGQFYERGKKAKQKVEGAKVALAETRRKLIEVKERIKKVKSLSAEPAEALEELAKRKIKHKEWFEKYRWFVSSDGFLVVAGKDAVSNEVLIKKHTVADDIIFHADVVGAPFVVIKTEGKEPNDQCLREAGEFAAAFSKGWREGFGSVDVYWVKPDQLSKGGPSGESVPRGAFAVRGERNWMRNIPLRIAIGVTVDEEKGLARIGGGPLGAVKAKADAYVIVVPGDLTGKELFKHVLRSLAGKVSKKVQEAILKLSVEAIREYIPYGRGIVIRE